MPDYRKGDDLQIFPLPSIRELLELLKTTHNPIFNPLIEKIDYGIKQLSDVQRFVNTLKKRYQTLTPEEQQLVKDYIAWIFFTSMTMRYWKGPGFTYPAIWKERGGQELCDLGTRDRNVQKRLIQRQRILDAMTPELREFVLTFPRVSYNFDTGDRAMGKETLNFVSQKVAEGDMCLADASDRFVQTAYYLMTNFLDIPDAEINNYLREELERIDILYLLNPEIQERFQTLRKLSDEINNIITEANSIIAGVQNNTMDFTTAQRKYADIWRFFRKEPMKMTTTPTELLTNLTTLFNMKTTSARMNHIAKSVAELWNTIVPQTKAEYKAKPENITDFNTLKNYIDTLITKGTQFENQRVHDLKESIKTQSNFRAQEVTHTKHEDPYHRRQEIV